jgi:hypothetical protein
MLLRTSLAALALATLSAGAFAQTPAPAAPAATPGVDQRQANQDKRIDQGIASGQLTNREARRLEHQQARIDRAEGRAKADGSVNANERRRLHHMQDHASKNIRRQKHDAQAKPRAAASSGG